ncbi:MAG: ketohydroxyglutarate aldolase [Actinomycetota bacterium]|nr:ketohydroxyglutarate aldolase [Actinomycetota bacterium]
MSERVVITVSGDDRPIAGVAARLEAAGVTVEKVLDAVGVIVGTVAEDGVRALAEIEGVGAVEKDREIRLPPPDSDVQ